MRISQPSCRLHERAVFHLSTHFLTRSIINSYDIGGLGIRFATMRSDMVGLRQKLLFGFGGLLAILLLVSGLGIAVLTQYRGALDKFYYENWRSIEYGQNKVYELEKLNDNAKPISGADHEPNGAELSTASKA